MKTLALLVGVFALAIAALIAGRYATQKQQSVFPPGSNNTAVRTVQDHGTSPWPQATQQDEAKGSKSGQSAAMPQSDIAYGPDNRLVVSGCLQRESGEWVLSRQNEPAFRLSGELSRLEPNAGRWIQVAGYAEQAEAKSEGKTAQANRNVFVVEQLNQVGPGCNQDLPVTVAVPGESGLHGADVPTTTTDSRREPTSGELTGTGRRQAPGTKVGAPEQQTPPADEPSVVEGAPPNLDTAGQDPFAAEKAAQGVERSRKAAKRATGQAGSGQQGNQESQQKKQEGSSSNQP